MPDIHTFFTDIIKGIPFKEATYLICGLAKFHIGKDEEAIKCFDEEIKLHPNNADAYFERGHVKYFLREYEEAVKDFDEAMKLNPIYGDAYLFCKIATMESGGKIELTHCDVTMEKARLEKTKKIPK